MASPIRLANENNVNKRAPIFHVINVTAGENDTTKRAPIFHVNAMKYTEACSRDWWKLFCASAYMYDLSRHVLASS